jgi:M6 family metalloprotease-like protein
MHIRNRSLALIVLFSLLLGSSAHAAIPKTVSKCTKLGATAIGSNKKFTCIKSGSKLVWNKGVAIPVTPKPSSTPVQPSPSPSSSASASPTSSIKTSNLSDYRPIKVCELINAGQNDDVNQSHATRASLPIDTKRNIRVLIFSIDFPDLKSTSQNAPDFKELVSQIDTFYTSMSNGKINFTWTISPKFERMSKTVESYGVGSRAAGSVWQLNNDIQDLAFQNYKKEDFDVVIGSAPTTTTREQIASSPAFPTRDSRYKPATYLGGDYWSNRQSWTIPAHEFGHFALGLADLYDFKSSMLGQAGFEQQFQYMGVYDMMNYAEGAGLEFSAWNRWIGKLITDSQMLCLPNASTTTLLKPIEDTKSEIKGIIVPLTKSSALVIENRAAIGFDKALPSGAQGIIVYEVDTSIETGYGPMRIIRKAGSKDVWFKDNAMKNGDSITHLGYTIKVVGSSGSNYYVEVSKQG